MKDNRLTPAGFSKSQVPNDVKVSGAAADDDPDFDDGSDLVTYRIPVCSRQKLEVTATLNYRALSYRFLRDLFTDDALPEVARFKQLYADQGILAETIARVTFTVTKP